MNRWTDAQTYYHFANALRNPAHEWLSSVLDWDDEEHDQPLLSDFKYIFKQEYAVQTNERIILEGLANLAMKPSEMMNELLTRITRTTRVIQESFAEYGGITPDPLKDRNHSFSNCSLCNFKKQYTTMMFNFFKMNTTMNMDLTLLELNLIGNISQELQPLPSKIQVFSNELDDSPHPSS
jgi:hypothetical protein